VRDHESCAKTPFSNISNLKSVTNKL
jgi:hypothetical protein